MANDGVPIPDNPSPSEPSATPVPKLSPPNTKLLHEPVIDMNSLPTGASGPHQPRYARESHQQLALFLEKVKATGKLGANRKEKMERNFPPIIRFFRTIPWIMLIFQLVWSGFVTAIAYILVEDREANTLTQTFWGSLWLLSPTVVLSIGWALFVLLGFFIREAANRYREALLYWGTIGVLLKQVIRQLVQAYPEGTWHPGDHDRIVAHLIAYPIALKMTLRDERDHNQLEKILDTSDIDDILASASMHQRCTRVVRAYFSAGEDDAHAGFKPAASKTPAGFGPRYFVIDLVDAIDGQAAGAQRIKTFRPAAGYSSHLRIFLYIWLLFLPMSIVQTSGWFTPLWSVIITYGIGMLFTIAMNLNEPYGFDLEDIKLNSLCAESALEALDTYALGQVKLEEIIKEEPAPLPWMSSELTQNDEYIPIKQKKSIAVIGWIFKFIKNMTFKRRVALPMACFVLWMVFVVFLTWGLGVHVFELDPNENTDDSIFCRDVRWWCMYIPLSPSTTAYIGLGIFLLLGFWINDAYGRYKTGISLWQVKMRRSLEHIAMIFCTEFRNESWHPGDRERLLSHIVALPYAAKISLRDSRDTEELSNILSRQDYLALTKAKDFPEYCLNVIYGYLNSADRGHETSKAKSPLGSSTWVIEHVLWDFELALEECEELHKFPISHAFTFHLKVFSMVWLAALPLAFVNFYGFVSFLFLLPVGYSIINLLVMGTELADPFGTDEHDIPLDMFCDQMKASFFKMYRETSDGPKSYTVGSLYDRADFKPRFWNSDPSILETDDGLSLIKSVNAILDAFPSVNIWVFLTFFVWCCAAVGISYAFQFTWSQEKPEDCRAWRSPIDVDGNLLLEIGFALFLILSFRASDALGRHAEGSSLMSEIGTLLRGLALLVVKTVDDRTWPKGGKERLVAHLVQLPLAIRDRMLGIERLDPQEKEGILSDEDRLAMENSGDAVRHCVQLLHTYINMLDCTDTERCPTCTTIYVEGFEIYTLNKQVYQLRMMLAQILVMKSFPVVKSYTTHQRVFTAIWLVLLPLSLTPEMGFWTILWVPLISYGVLALEAVATKLMDPFGTDAVDIPLDGLCKEYSADVLEAVWSAKWDCSHNVLKSVADSDPSFDVVIQGKAILDKYSLPHMSAEPADASTFGRTLLPTYKSPQQKMTKPTLYAHLLRSVPWWILLGTALWSALAVVVSYLARKGGPAERWWISQLHVDPLVGSYVSFAAFMMLGFYVNAAFARYSMAGTVWGDDLRASCHSLATQVVTLAPPGTWHEGDHKRIFAHIASLPIALKKDVRGDRNLVELKGLLSEKDIGRLHCAKSMSKHCLDVLHSYLFTVTHHPDRLAHQRAKGFQETFFLRELGNLGSAIRRSLFLKSSQIAPGFMILLRTLLAIWFVFLPFVLAESDGWFSILWVTIIAYGVIGVYAVAQELQHPFGTDLNDLDLDKVTSQIVDDVLFIQKNYHDGIDTFVLDIPDSGDIWRVEVDKNLCDEKLNLVSKDVKKEVKSGFMRNLSLAIHTVKLWMLVAVVAWTLIYVGIAYGVNEHFPFRPGGGMPSTECEPSFCSRISITGPVKEYIGFALFLLLGFRLYDSHWRYVTAMKLWEEGILGITGLLGNRMFECFNEGTFHRGDLERMAAHLAAFSVVTTARLRRVAPSADVLGQIMHPDDVMRVEHALEKGDYCLDVLRGYFLKSDMNQRQGLPYSAGVNERWTLIHYLEILKQSSAACEQMIRVPLPFGYVQHIRILLVIWLLLLPLGLVETQSWYSAIWSLFIAYGLIGVERWSEELADPFGTDLSDLPLGKLRMRAVKSVKDNLELFRYGTQAVIKTDRESFPSGKA